MKFMFAIVAASVVVAGTSAANAEINDPMEMQRCIHACLFNSNGADDPAYHRCLKRQCTGDEPAQKKSSRQKAKSKKYRSGKMRARQSAPKPRDIIVQRVNPVYAD